MDDSQSENKSSVLWTYIRAVTKFQGRKGSANITRGRYRKKFSYTHADSFIHKYTTRNCGEISEDSDCEPESELDETDAEDSDTALWKRVVKPDGKFLYYWLFFVTLTVIYYLWFLVARHTWLRHGEQTAFMKAMWITCDTICDVIIFCDIIVQARTGYLEHGILVTDGRKLIKRYIRTIYFACDIISLTPISIIYRIATSECMPLLKLHRCLKIYRARQFSSKVESAASHPNGVRIFNFVHVLFLLTHWFAAVYFLVSEGLGFGKGNWVYPNNTVEEFSSISRQYLASFYWSTITLTTIGDIPRPESNLEFVIQIFGYMLGVFVFATIVGQVGTVVENRNSVRLEFERHVDNAKRYMREHKVPHQVQKPILRWYEYAWTRGKFAGRGDVNSLGLLPTKLRAELALHVNLKALKKVSFFRRCQPEFLHDLVLKMQLNVITPGELLCRKGELAREVFIVSDGRLNVIGKRGKVIRKLETGDFFGEIGTIVSEDTTDRRTVDVRSVGYSELFFISKEDIIGLIKDYPQSKKVLEETARSYNFNKSRRRRNASRRPKERNSVTFLEENDKPIVEINYSEEPSSPGNETTNLIVPNDHVIVKLRPAPSFNSKKRRKENRPSLRFIPEGTTRKRRSIYRRLSEEANGGTIGGVKGTGTKRVTFAESLVEVPDDIATIVENKMGHIGDDVKSLLAYTRQLEDKVKNLTQEKEFLEEEVADLRGLNTVVADTTDETNV